MNTKRADTLVSLFDDAAERFGNRIAGTFGAQHLTYRELKNKADDLAARLALAGVGQEDLVGCCCERSLDLLVALLGILKAGAAYVPLDPTYPGERLAHMLDDCGCKVIVTIDELPPSVKAISNARVIAIRSAVGAELAAPPSVEVTPRSLAYVMYTSGSTGRPKGVLVEHRSIVRLVRETTYCAFGPDQTWLHFAPLPFDASTLEIWGPLLNGGRVVIAPERASLEDLGRLVRNEGVTSMWLTSGLFNLMIERRVEDLEGVKQLLAGGDVLSPFHVRRALSALPNCTVINGYGPTENTTFTCCHPMRSGEAVPEPVPVGRAISGTTVYVLDEQGQPVADGDLGELYAGGDGVARGYLNNPEATAERFLPDPFSSIEGARMYRTGDLVRRDRDGTIHFAGRSDNQVKILGHRIEPGEIEATISAHPAIQQACVMVQTSDEGKKRLIAYYIADAASGLSIKDLREYLAGKLPRYMMPALIVPMCAMPLTQNGKIDRAALPRPEFKDAEIGEPAIGQPQSIEDMIVSAWRQHLGLATVGLDDSFFDLGGDSLKLVAMHADLERMLEREIPILDVFEFTTPRALARHLGGDAAAKRATAAADQHRAVQQRNAFGRLRRAHAR